MGTAALEAGPERHLIGSPYNSKILYKFIVAINPHAPILIYI